MSLLSQLVEPDRDLFDVAVLKKYGVELRWCIENSGVCSAKTEIRHPYPSTPDVASLKQRLWHKYQAEDLHNFSLVTRGVQPWTKEISIVKGGAQDYSVQILCMVTVPESLSVNHRSSTSINQVYFPSLVPPSLLYANTRQRSPNNSQ